MIDGVILGVAVAAGVACPLHMWWSHKRGRQAACCPAGSDANREGEIDALRVRQERLSMLISEHEATVAGTAAVEVARAAARD